MTSMTKDRASGLNTSPSHPSQLKSQLSQPNRIEQVLFENQLRICQALAISGHQVVCKVPFKAPATQWKKLGLAHLDTLATVESNDQKWCWFDGYQLFPANKAPQGKDFRRVWQQGPRYETSQTSQTSQTEDQTYAHNLVFER
jgi:hypothetical protein